jgi:hypothetical protein
LICEEFSDRKVEVEDKIGRAELELDYQGFNAS